MASHHLAVRASSITTCTPGSEVPGWRAVVAFIAFLPTCMNILDE